jgi:prepilin-type N-terminal cleavage/methylation domain-containing protein
MQKSEAGFSLLEFSIVIVIIGLLAMGLTTGEAMARASRVQTIISEVSQHKTAFANFKQTYNYLPGDMPDAAKIWTSQCEKAACNGNGDGQVQFGSIGVEKGREHVRAWQHLALAGMISGQYSGTEWPEGTDSARLVASKNIPSSDIAGAVWNVYSDVPLRGHTGNRLVLSAAPTAADGVNLPEAGVIAADEAADFDNKADDGNPETGVVQSANAAGASNCIIASDNSKSYAIGNQTSSCQVSYFIR